MTTRAVAPAALLALALLAGCGGGATTSATSTSTVAPTSTAAPTSARQGIAPGEPTPGAQTPASSSSLGTKPASISPRATATVSTDDFCSALKAAEFKESDLTTLPTTSRRELTEEIVDRMERLASVTPPTDLEGPWRDTIESYDTIGSEAEAAASDAELKAIVTRELAAVAPARDKVLAVTRTCR